MLYQNKNNCKNYLSIVKEMIVDNKLLLISGLFMLLAYGFYVSNSSLSIDDLHVEYLQGFDLISQGRFFAYVLDKITPILKFSPFFTDIISLILMYISAVFMLAFFQLATKRQLMFYSKCIFLVVYLIFPLHTNLFSYSGTYTLISIEIIFVCLAITLMLDFMVDKKLFKLLLATILYVFVCSGYESVLPIALLLISLYAFINVLHSKEIIKFKNVFLYFLIMIIPICIGVIMESLIANMIVSLMGIEVTSISNGIFWQISNPLYNVIDIVVGTGFYYFFCALMYFPITLFIIASIFFVIYAFSKILQYKSVNLLLITIAVFVSIFSLSIIQGTFSTYRMMTVIAVFVAYVTLFLNDNLYYYIIEIKSNNKRYYIYHIFIGILLLLSVELSYETNLRLSDNVHISKYEEKVVENIAWDMTQLGIYDNPVIFVNELNLNDSDWYIRSNYYKVENKIIRAYLDYRPLNVFEIEGDLYTELAVTGTTSYMNWAIDAFDDVQKEMQRMFKYYGYNINIADAKQISAVIEKFESDNSKNYLLGYLLEYDGYAVVDLSRIPN